MFLCNFQKSSSSNKSYFEFYDFSILKIIRAKTVTILMQKMIATAII